jgi:ABC-type transport system involved in multi-copper enzyme maturation permease subunit
VAFVYATWKASTPPLLHAYGPRPIGINRFQFFGTTLFGSLDATLFAAIWVLAPLLAADAISRERREGTLGLLFLTPLTATGVVLGKSSVHWLRGLTLFLCMAPWLMLPLLMGGVEVRDVAMALLLDASALMLALAAGPLATCGPRDWLKAVLLAELLSFLFLLGFLSLHAVGFERAIALGLVPGAVGVGTPFGWLDSQGRLAAAFYPDLGAGVLSHFVGLWVLATNFQVNLNDLFWGAGRGAMPQLAIATVWGKVWGFFTPATHHAWFIWAVELLVLSALGFCGAMALAARRVAASWRDAPVSARDAELREVFLRQRYWQQRFRRRMTRSLNRNPIGWLQQYSPTARLVKWGWCLFVLIAEVVLTTSVSDLYQSQRGLLLLLMLALGFSAVGSFRRERESGALELLLVAPLRINQISFGRLRGLWMQFLPALLVVVAANFYLNYGWAHPPGDDDTLALVVQFGGTFVTLPVIGLWFSMRRMNFIVAWLVACAVAIFLPWSPIERAAEAWLGLEPTLTDLMGPLLVQIALASAAWLKLHLELSRRKFALR